MERFERSATGEKWAKGDWAIRLSALLKGRTLEIFSRLPQEQALDYDQLKVALLQNYQMTEDGYRVRFRTCRPEKQETPTQFASRNKSYFENWVRLSKIPKDYDHLMDLLLREQFVNSCSRECTVYLKERTCSNMEEMCGHAEKFVEAHGLYKFANSPNKLFNPGKPNSKPMASHQGSAAESGRQPAQTPSVYKNPSNKVKCYNCKEYGHLSFTCPKARRSSSGSPTMALVDQQKALVEAVKEVVARELSSKPEASACLPVEAI